MNKIIQNIKKFLNRYNPKAFTSMLLYLSNDLIDFKVDVIEKFNQLKEMYKKDNNYLEDEFDTLQNKVDCIENDYNDYCVELEKKINNLESTQLVILKSLNKPIDTKIDEVANELILSEFSTYLCDSIDLFDYDYNQVKRDVLIALIDCKEYNISIKRRINNNDNSSNRKVN